MQARLVLVHSPLVGCGTWEPVARDLAGDGYAVTVPDLAGAAAAGPPWWGEEELTVLLPDSTIRQYFTAGCPRLPLAMLDEILPPAPGRPDAPCGYLQLSEAYEGEAARAREPAQRSIAPPITGSTDHRAGWVRSGSGPAR